jgi:hypothetical protein
VKSLESMNWLKVSKIKDLQSKIDKQSVSPPSSRGESATERTQMANSAVKETFNLKSAVEEFKTKYVQEGKVKEFSYRYDLR